MKIVALVFELLLLLGGVLALSGIIVAKRPDARAVIDRLVPFQALIGIALLVMSVVFLFVIGPGALLKSIKAYPVPAMANLGGIIVGFLLGALFGMVQLARAGSPQNQQRAVEITQRLAPFQALLGLIALGAAGLGLAYTLGLMKLADKAGVSF